MSESPEAPLLADAAVQAAADVLAAYVRDDRDCLFLSGSRLDGLGNDHSDWDFFLVRADEDATTDGTAEQYVPASYVDCEIVSSARLDAIAAAVEAAAGGAGDVTLDVLSNYYRVIIGRPVLHPARFAELQRGFSREVLRTAYTRWARRRARGHLSLAVAALADDVWYAALNAREAAFHVVDALLADAGELYPNPKWWHEKAVRAFGAGSDLTRELWALTNIGDASPEAYVLRVTEFATGRGGVPAPAADAPVGHYVLGEGLTVVSRGETYVVAGTDGKAATASAGCGRALDHALTAPADGGRRVSVFDAAWVAELARYGVLRRAEAAP